jgi:hypothetical protein
MLMFDETNKQLYIFATSTSTHAGGDSIYRRSDLPSDPAHGLRFTAAQRFLAGVGLVNNVASAKAR